jgi:hypothetical protein
MTHMFRIVLVYANTHKGKALPELRFRVILFLNMVINNAQIWLPLYETWHWFSLPSDWLITWIKRVWLDNDSKRGIQTWTSLFRRYLKQLIEVISEEHTVAHTSCENNLLFVFFSSELAKAAAETNGAIVSECVRKTCTSGRNYWTSRYCKLCAHLARLLEMTEESSVSTIDQGNCLWKQLPILTLNRVLDSSPRACCHRKFSSFLPLRLLNWAKC